MTKEQREKFKELLHELDNKKILQHFVLIGSWAELLYEETGLIEEFKPTLRTQDLDFLLKDKSKTKKFAKPKDVSKILGELGYEIDQLWPEGYERYQIFSDEFEDEMIMYVEFLASETGKTGENPKEYDQFGIKHATIQVEKAGEENSCNLDCSKSI